MHPVFRIHIGYTVAITYAMSYVHRYVQCFEQNYSFKISIISQENRDILRKWCGFSIFNVKIADSYILQKSDLFAIPLYFLIFLYYSSNGAISISLYER